MAETQKEIATRLLAEMGVGTTEKMGKAQQVKLGSHKLAVLDGGFIVNAKTKLSRNPEQRVVVHFVVLESRPSVPTDPAPYEPGAKIQVAFFIMRPKFPEYEVSRYQDMVEAMQTGLQAGGTQADFGGRVLAAEGRGIQVQLEITQGGAHKNKAGAFYADEAWAPVPQSEEDVAALSAELTEAHGAWKDPGSPAPRAAQAPAAAPAPAKRGFLK